jgi:4-amino-4-deoxy-L-arabinose transferase-like glycosyltransferase
MPLRPRPRPPAPLSGGRRGASPSASLLVLASLALLAALLHLGIARLHGPFSSPVDRPLSGDEKRYVEVATAWASGESAELDPLWPPGYPAAVALLLRSGGSLAGLVCLQIAALFVAGVLLGRLALELGAPPQGALLAAALFVANPEVAGFAWLYRPEALHLALFVLALLLVLRAARAVEERRRSLLLILLGLVLGVAIALKSLLLPFVPLLLLPVLRLPGGTERLQRSGLVALALLAVLLPVALFQRANTGVWTIGGSARFNLWVGLTDRSSRSLAEDRTWEEYLRYRAAGATFAERQGALGRQLRELVTVRGLPRVVADQFPRQYFRLFDRESYFSASLPPSGRRFLAGEGYRSAPPRLARLFAGGETALYAVLLVCAPFGLIRLARERGPGGGMIALLCGGQLLLFWFVHVKARYRLTLLPLFVLGVAWAFETMRRRLRGETGPIPGVELALGAAGAAALLYFAFGAP